MSEINLSHLSATQGFNISGPMASALAGYSLCGAGDVNGDGLSDLIIGAYGVNYDNVDSFAGEAYVIYGSEVPIGNVNLANLDSSIGFTMFVTVDDMCTGISVSGAGDINGDGFGDVIVGAYTAFDNEGVA